MDIRKRLLVLAAGAVLVAAPAHGFQDIVDSTWADTNRVPKGTCRNFVVQAGPPPVLRGKTSGRDCLTQAVRAYHEGDHEEAFGWILAGQCHDREAREELVRHAPDVLHYVIEKYGGERR